jgi:asparagine synthase (glutamine-hydrolysing)
MCGLTGLVRLDGGNFAPQALRLLLARSLDRIRHRGPDDAKIYVQDAFGLAFCRLAIIDPEGGQQPIWNESGTLFSATNGEIFNHAAWRPRLERNHQLGSASDCEVITHLYEEFGIGYLEQVNGIFATAILDRQSRRLYLARDRLGVKPLFYFVNDGHFGFASEIKALLAYPQAPRSFDWNTAVAFRQRMFLPREDRLPDTHFLGIRQLPGGSYLELDLDSGSYEIRRWWDPAAAGPPLSSNAECVAAYREILSDSVDMQLMSDVPMGVFLSGGIDSLSVTSLAARGATIRSFSVLSQSTMTNGDAAHAHAAAERLGIEAHLVKFDWRDMAVTPELWKSILWSLETPLANAEHLYKFFLYGYAKAHFPDLKVMLLGSGSDEFNGGYAATFCRGPETPNWQDFLGQMSMLTRASEVEFGIGRNEYLALDAPDGVFAQAFLSQRADSAAYKHPWHAYRDAYRYLLQVYHLWHEDRTAAAHGIEARVPFLDHRLVELCYRVPQDCYEAMFWNKAILRDAVHGIVPDDLRMRPKVPFFTGEDERYTRRMLYTLLCHSNMALVEEACSAGQDNPALDADAMRRVLASISRDPEFALVDRVFELVNMALLSRMVSEPPAAQPTPVLERIEIGPDWPSFEKAASVDMVARDKTLTVTAIPKFAPGVRLVECVTGDPDFGQAGALFIMVGSELRYELSDARPEWRSFLATIDGHTSIETLLQDLRFERHCIWKDLEESVEFGVIVV